MAWTTRHEPLPGDWKKRRRYVRARAGERCEGIVEGSRCREAGAYCDHIINTRSPEGRAMGDAVHSTSNLQWLCKSCHDTKTQQEARAGRAARPRVTSRHPGEAHPSGLRLY